MWLIESRQAKARLRQDSIRKVHRRVIYIFAASMLFIEHRMIFMHLIDCWLSSISYLLLLLLLFIPFLSTDEEA